MTEPCCPDQERDPHEWGECMLIGTGQPGADRRAFLRAQERTQGQGQGLSDSQGPTL